jgi:hypothetical protein
LSHERVRPPGWYTLLRSLATNPSTFVRSDCVNGRLAAKARTTPGLKSAESAVQEKRIL